jgi:AMP-polyphosphate phosphotransferase
LGEPKSNGLTAPARGQNWLKQTNKIEEVQVPKNKTKSPKQGESTRKGASSKKGNYKLLNNGAIAITGNNQELLAPYQSQKIPDYLDLIDHSLTLSEKQYSALLAAAEVEFNELVRQLKNFSKSLLIVFQGRDASGKSGATERIIEALDFDPRIFLWVPISAPTEEEGAHPYLWRFTTGDRMPKYGQVRIFDRSWAERVLAERVLQLTKKSAIQHSYTEIRAFEWLLESQGIILIKFWMDITKEEQLKRFKARAQKKPWKVAASDAKDRKLWNGYTLAANELFHRTSTQSAPWYVISSEDKLYSRVTVLQVINQQLRKVLKG